jgi:hypothetical protein
MGNNILLNPELKGFNTPPREFVDKNGNKGWMENPDNWEFVWTPLHEDDPNLVPQSLHRDRGYCIAAGWRVWEAGYVQRGVHLHGGQRYVAKAAFQPDVNFTGGQKPDLTAIQWRFWVEGEGEKVWSEWQTTTKGEYKQEEEHLFVIEPRRDITVDVYFKARSTWASNVCDFNIRSITLEEVASDFGTPTYIGSPQSAEVANFSPVSSSTPSTPPVPSPAETITTLYDAMTDDDLTVIIAGFRAAANMEHLSGLRVCWSGIRHRNLDEARSGVNTFKFTPTL